jgi:hypothetical protein
MVMEGICRLLHTDIANLASRPSAPLSSTPIHISINLCLQGLDKETKQIAITHVAVPWQFQIHPYGHCPGLAVCLSLHGLMNSFQIRNEQRSPL